MECRELNQRAVDRLTGQADPEADRDLSTHVDSCAACRAELDAIERAWAFLGEEPGPEPTSEFRRRGRALLEDEMLRKRVREFRPRQGRRWAAQAAAVFLAAGAGYLAASRKAPEPAASIRSAGTPAGSALPGLGANSRLSNLSYQPFRADGRIGIGFDVTTRHVVEGSPADPEVTRLLAYLLSGPGENAGERSRAIELVQRHYGSGVTPASPDIVAALTRSLRQDPNPGVRKKAADALAALPAAPEIRSAFLDALHDDRNPAVRLVAIEALAAAAKGSPDARTIQSLREKAVDSSENGFVRARAASALKTMDF